MEDLSIVIPTTIEAAHQRAMNLAAEVLEETEQFAKTNDSFARFLFEQSDSQSKHLLNTMLRDHLEEYGYAVCACKSINTKFRIAFNKKFFFCNDCEFTRRMINLKRIIEKGRVRIEDMDAKMEEIKNGLISCKLYTY
jgi:ferredoxin-thioredoxin reductase catalytic subunit